MKKTVWWVKLALGLSLIAGPSYSSAAEMVKIGVVDLQRIIQEAPESVRMGNELKKTFEPRQQKIIEANKKMQANEERLKRDAAVMGASDRSSLENKIRDDKRDLQRMAQDYQDDLTTARNKDMQTLFAHIRSVIEKIAKKEGFDIVLEKQAAPYVNEKMDITQDIIKAAS